MSGHELPKQPPGPAHHLTSSWDIAGLAHALDTDLDPLPDLEQGAGFSLMVGEVSPFRPFKQVILYILPTAHTVRLVSPGLLLELDEVSPPVITSHQVIFRWAEPGGGDQSFTLTRKGEVLLQRIPSGTADEENGG